MSRSQDSHLVQIELDVARRRLAVRVDGHAATIHLRSRGWLGLFAYLIAARLDGRAEGYRTDGEILAEAPGWSRVQKVRSVGKKISDIIGRHDVLGAVVQAPNGVTLPPWRVAAEPTGIRVAEPARLQALLDERRTLPQNLEARQDGHVPTLDELGQAEVTIARGAAVGSVATWVESVIRRASSLREPLVRAEAARLEAMLLRRRGVLKAANRRAEEALAWFSEHAGEEPLRLASTLNELGVIRYRAGDLPGANGLFLRELQVLETAGDGRAAHRGRARCLHSLAHVAFRRKEHDEAMRLARSAGHAAGAARDEVGRLLARAVECRILAHRGGLRDAPMAAARLERLTNLIPVTDPEAVLMGRRLLLEALYLAEDEAEADKLAYAIVRDAQALGYARELDQVVWMLRYFRRREAVRALPANVPRTKRDRVEDWEVMGAARVRVGLRRGPGVASEKPRRGRRGPPWKRFL